MILWASSPILSPKGNPEPGVLADQATRHYALSLLPSVQECGQSSHIFSMGLFNCHSLFMAVPHLVFSSMTTLRNESASQLPSRAFSCLTLYRVRSWLHGKSASPLYWCSVMSWLHAWPHPRPACLPSLSAGTLSSIVPILESTAVAFPWGPPQSPSGHWELMHLMSDFWSPRVSILENWIYSWG